MIGTWHGSCYACTCTTLDHQFQFAPPASSPGACAKGGRCFPLLASAATSLDDAQMYDGHRAGASRRFGARGCDRHTPAHRQGRAHVSSVCRAFRFCFLFDLPVLTSRGLTSPGVFSGIGKRSTAPLANLIHHRRQRGFQAFAKRLPSHSSAPAVYVLKRRCGVIGSAQKAIGVYQNDDC